MSVPPALLLTLDGAAPLVRARFSVLAAGKFAEAPVLLDSVVQTRQGADQLAAAIDQAVRPLGVRVSNAGRLVLLEAADDVTVELDTGDLVALEREVDPRTRLSSQTTGTRYRSDGLGSHDRQVVDSLAGMVAALGRGAAAETRLGQLAVDAMATAGTVAPATTASGSAPALAAAAQRLLAATAAATTARADQLDAIEQKEREAKRGGAAGQPGAPAPAGPPPGGGSGQPPGGGGPPAGGGGGGGPGSQPGGDQGGGGGTRPGEPAGAGEQSGRPAGSDQDPRPYKAPCEVRTYSFDGIAVTAGLFVGGEDGDGTWYLARGQYDLEISTPDGPVIVPDSYDFGQEGATDPDLRSQPIDIAVLDELVERRRREQQQADDPWADLRSFASFLADMTPFLGQVKSGLELLTGYDIIAGRKLSPAELAVVGVGILLPYAGAALKASAKTLLRTTRGLIRGSGAAVELGGPQLRALEDAFETFRQARRARGQPRVVIQSKQCGKPARRTGSGGLSRIRVKCFPAGTLVRTGGGPRLPIEQVRPGGAVARTHRSAARELVELHISDGQGRSATLRPTPLHPIGTGTGFVPAGELRRGDRVALAGGGWGQVVGRRLLTGSWPVHNLTVAGAHTYFASELDVLVHNTCDCTEFISQQTAEGILEQRGFRFLQQDGTFANTRNPATFAPEPEFTVRPNPQGTVAGQTAEFTGRPGRQLNSSQLRNPARDSTRPDIYGIENGTQVAYELKTIPGSLTVQQFFNRYKQTIRNQIGGRIGFMSGLPVEHRLMIDVRNIEAFDDLSGVLANLRELGGRQLPELTQYAGGVRFIQQGATGPELSRIYSWAEILAS